jgi:arylsulfatase A-like enzyme
VGQVLETLDRLKLTENTLVIFTSDNGPVVDDGYVDQAVEKLGAHRPAGILRGGKYSRFEGGTRVPFMVRWPARVKRGVSDALVSQVDCLASLAALTGQAVPTGEAPDSTNQLAAWLGQDQVGRDHVVMHAGGGLALRGPRRFKYIEPSQGPRRNPQTNTELANDPEPQLYDLATDVGETRNLASQLPDRVKAMADRLASIRR